MQILNVISASGSSMVWQPLEDSVILALKSFSTWVVSIDQSITYASLAARLGSGFAGDGIDSADYILINNNETLLNLSWFVPKDQKIFFNPSGGSALLSVFVL